MGHSGRGGGRGGRRSGSTPTLPKHRQLQCGAGACQCGAGKTVGDVTDVHVIHLGRKRSQGKFGAINKLIFGKGSQKALNERLKYKSAFKLISSRHGATFIWSFPFSVDPTKVNYSLPDYYFLQLLRKLFDSLTASPTRC